MEWTIHGLQPGMERAQVLERKGRPLGDGGWGQVVNCTPNGSPVRWEDYPVWHYGEVAVVFRGNRVVQVLGNQLEEEGTILRESHESLWQRDFGGVLESGEGQPFLFRLLPRMDFNLPAATPLLRNRLRATLRGLTSSRAVRFDLDVEGGDLAVAEDWVTGADQELRWTALALRRALWECIHHGKDYWRAGKPGWPTGHIILTNSWEAEAVHVRLRLLVDAEIRLAQKQGSAVPLKVALDEMDESECAAAWQRLLLAGRSPHPGYWQGLRGVDAPVKLMEDNRPTDALRWAAAQARLLDQRFGSHPFLYPGPPEGYYPIGVALAGSRGKSGWSWKGAATPDVRLDWDDPRHRFHAVWTPSGAVLKPFDKDRLSEVHEAAARLSQMGQSSVGDWCDGWGSSLPQDENERLLMRELERAPYFDRPVHHLASSLRQTALLSRQWLPSEPSSEQRFLAEGLARLIRFGLDVLGC